LWGDQLAFNDHGDGYVFNPDLFITYDGGRHWAYVPQAGIVLSVETLGYSVWMLEADCAPANPQYCTLNLQTSADGGVSWSESPSQPHLDSVSFVPAAGGLLGQTWLVRTSQSSAYVLSNPVQNPFGAPDQAALAFTDNGGESWTTSEVPCGFDAQSVEMSAAPDGSLLALCAGEPGAGNQVKTVLRSSDHGQTWTTMVPYKTLVAIDDGYIG